MAAGVIRLKMKIPQSMGKLKALGLSIARIVIRSYRDHNMISYAIEV